MMDRVFFGVPLPFLLENAGLIRQFPVNMELFVDGDVLEGLEPAREEKAREILDGFKLRRRVHGPISEMILGAFDPRVRQAAHDRTLEAIGFAARMGAKSVVMHSGFDNSTKRGLEERYRENLVPVLKSLCARAAGYGVRLLLENTFEPASDLLLGALTDTGADNLGLCFDIAHYTLFGKEPLGLWIERCAAMIEEVHVTDTLGDWDYHLAPGRGRIDFDAFFALLEKHGVKPVFTFEPHSLEAFEETLRYIKLHPGPFGMGEQAPGAGAKGI
jgi:sugar phosphate isomerase/epimerase